MGLGNWGVFRGRPIWVRVRARCDSDINCESGDGVVGGEGWESCLCDVEGHISRAFTRELRDEARGLTDDAVLGVHKACHRC